VALGLILWCVVCLFLCVLFSLSGACIFVAKGRGVYVYYSFLLFRWVSGVLYCVLCGVGCVVCVVFVFRAAEHLPPSDVLDGEIV